MINGIKKILRAIALRDYNTIGFVFGNMIHRCLCVIGLHDYVPSGQNNLDTCMDCGHYKKRIK